MWCRPLAGLLSWLVPTARIAKTEKNDLYPEIQAFFDQGATRFCAVLSLPNRKRPWRS